MTEHYKQLQSLAKVCDSDELELIDDMIKQAANYVQAVVIMEAAADNLAGRTGEDLRRTREETDRYRSKVHDSLIIRVNNVNKLCQFHGLPAIYTGDELRRHYGDFALELVSEIFTNRR